MKNSHRRILSCLFLIGYLIVWIWVAASLGSYVSSAPGWVSLLYFSVAGFAWILPMRLVFKWMNSGPEAS